MYTLTVILTLVPIWAMIDILLHKKPPMREYLGNHPYRK